MPETHTNPLNENVNTNVSIIFYTFHPPRPADYSKHPMGCEAQLAWKCTFTSTILTR